ncbi:tyrosine-type recombinase/integrase [Gallibacterium melopsittaci]|uniref:Tyrosine-type recombinase/integrase n=1 Tax=Gallibacterium melopsittaci TaxID=516063 RepID=A0ABV6I0M8_9PAST
MIDNAIPLTGMTFKEILNEYVTFKYLRPDTKESYIKVINQFEKFAPNILADEITQELVLKWRVRSLQKICPITWNNYMSHCHAIFNFGIKNNLIRTNKNPFKSMQVKVGKKRKKVIRDFHLSVLEDTLVSDKNLLPESYSPLFFTQAIIFTFIYTGIRRGQLLKLKVRDINLIDRTIFISSDINKNHDDHIIPISTVLFPYLERLLQEIQARHIAKNSQLFNLNNFSSVTRNKGNMTTDQLSHYFGKISKELGVSLSPHKFRHTLATNLMKNPEQNLYATQKILGHRDIKVTLTYIQPDVEQLRNAIESTRKPVMRRYF